MYKRHAITLPAELDTRLEKKRKEMGVSRSEFFRKAFQNFLGEEGDIDSKYEKKYAHIYKSLQEEDKKLAEEMNAVTCETLPND